TVCTGTETCDTTAHTCSSTGALDCNDSSPCTTDSCDPVTGCSNVLIDADGDGHAPIALGACGDDCDDSQPTVYRGAEELCDGLDNDCDTDVDEIRPTWFVDCDGDGYAGSLVSAMQACDQPSAAATGCGTPTATWTATRPTGTSNTDCADDDPARRPGAMELATCNGIDEDCDGAADNGVTATLTVNRMGTGAGSVASSPTGLACPSTCTRAFLCGTSVSLTPTANLGSTFGGWGGDCTGSGACSVSMSANRVVNATFNATYNLVVNTSGMGGVSLNPSGTSCGAGCTTYASGTPVTLTAMPASGWSFVRWTGGCSGTVPTCNLTMTTNHNVTAQFVQMRTLSVSRTGTGTGTVTSGEGMISCGGTCTAMYPDGTGVSLQATADPGSMFNGWGGACAGFGGTFCNVTMSGNQSVTASFVPACGAPGSSCGSGTPCCSGLYCVSGSCQTCRPDGNSCSTSSECCTGNCFGGICGGSGTVRLTIQFTNQCNARVRVDPIGATCDDFASPCAYSFSPGQFINLTAEGAAFRQWLGGPCAGSTSTVCSFSITSDMTVTTDWWPC
ncbi:MAG: hypothetical protein K8H88_25500, partial [Sandaracinaceae bacterium]|nr:hypothetical protein [Sandaracinaceae bacterium]